jgi:hypothetical protein
MSLVCLQFPIVVLSLLVGKVLVLELGWDNPHEWLTIACQNLSTAAASILTNCRDKQLRLSWLTRAAMVFQLSIEPPFKTLVAVCFDTLSTHLVSVQTVRIISISSSYQMWQCRWRTHTKSTMAARIDQCRKHLHTCREVATLPSSPSYKPLDLCEYEHNPVVTRSCAHTLWLSIYCPAPAKANDILSPLSTNIRDPCTATEGHAKEYIQFVAACLLQVYKD